METPGAQKIRRKNPGRALAFCWQWQVMLLLLKSLEPFPFPAFSGKTKMFGIRSTFRCPVHGKHIQNKIPKTVQFGTHARIFLLLKSMLHFRVSQPFPFEGNLEKWQFQGNHHFTVLGACFWFSSCLVLFIFTGGLQKTVRFSLPYQE